MRARYALALVLLSGALVGCGLFRGSPTVEPVNEPQIVRFAERIDRFYRKIENTPLDVRATFEDPELRGYFANEADFASYYASLADSIRRSLFRNSTATRVNIQEFRFESPDVAAVEIVFVGLHVRRLRRGEIELPRRDTWRLVDDRWLLTPAKL